MKISSKISALSVILLMGTACPSETPEPGATDTGGGTGGDTGIAQDAGNTGDTGGTESDAANGQPDASDAGLDACVPLEVCSAQACGMVDDGCGGTLDCGACDCVEGVPVESTCGPCGLGTFTCAADVTGPGTCVAPDVGGVDLDDACGNIVHVDSSAAAANPDGTAQAPYPTLSAAIRGSSAPAVILVATGRHLESNPVRTTQGFHIVGGFDPADWSFDPQSSTTLEFVSTADDGRSGFSFGGVTTPTVVAHLNVELGNAQDGKTTIATYVSGSPALVLSNFVAVAGDAGDGADGADGADGTQGNKGADATLSDPGAGGVNSACPQANGGRGGNGARNVNNQLFDAEPGEDSSGQARGGPAGTMSLPLGEDGSIRQQPPAGTDGDSGRSAGSFIDGEWTLIFGDGEPGVAGSHGAGGGGGGGSFWPTDSRTNPGANGGGGGSGGCAGGRGQGGQAGGSSFGLVVIDSTGLTLRDSSFTAGDAGNGGRGGDGGRGGNASAGGAGSSKGTITGGSGGAGAAGSDGGRGGAGAGGSSYGAWCEVSTLNIEGNVSFTQGSEGLGGVSTLPAEDGVAVQQNGCQ